MGDGKKKPNAADLEKLSLYQRYLAERDEVLRHKWLESERAGRDIGFERALMDWVLNTAPSGERAARQPGSDSA
ncbi:MAG: hypothetical protein CM1200mP29_02250 [Verrucomicrobiota bacterium]|nr:MAG: hypothetical protein CM1200mP29_02250 [Verrucomicrobiota bacterium]